MRWDKNNWGGMRDFKGLLSWPLTPSVYGSKSAAQRQAKELQLFLDKHPGYVLASWAAAACGCSPSTIAKSHAVKRATHELPGGATITLVRMVDCLMLG